VPDLPVPWEFHGGNGIDHTDVWVDAFWMDQTEVTRAAYSRFIEASGYRPPHVSEDWAADGWNWTGSTPPPDTTDHPVVLVSWYDAREYCAWAGKRLPSEAEWQLAALGPWGQSLDYPWGNTYDNARLNHGQMAPPNFDDSDGYLTTSPVGRFPSGASPFGALDMFGNAWEYTADLRVDTWSLMTAIEASTRAHPDGKRAVRVPEPGLYAAVRGGSYFFDLRPNPGGERNRFLTEIRRKTSGFRCARNNKAAAATETTQ
jgi:formylglycine-generating enzyme required for sulfatase activity